MAKRPRYCPNCGYDQVGAAVTNCPECNAEQVFPDPGWQQMFFFWALIYNFIVLPILAIIVLQEVAFVLIFVLPAAIIAAIIGMATSAEMLRHSWRFMRWIMRALVAAPTIVAIVATVLKVAV